ncbi:hypothetical protein GKE82_11315 [Conexibacter sp. W3-3-2]|uniref:hypothetical protein n=1 Tax=Conexibacter sp. W3-3-2 TaxID=2675227 RepID=UPI0012BA3792|nr:hypothetical protein [Conexibacter sp. W3-3-2]MTD44863.1 hypothetical protein [Conexibacter sp. W3-3-2]
MLSASVVLTADRLLGEDPPRMQFPDATEKLRPMSDPSAASTEELQKLLAAWERERPRMWSRVVELRGNEYQAAYGAYMATRSEIEDVKDELRRRGVIRRGRPRKTAQIPAGSAPRPRALVSVECDDAAVAVTSDGHVRLSEGDRLDVRVAVLQGIGGLREPPGAVLEGIFTGRKPTKGTDVENLLLLNMQVPASRIADGFRFEHIDDHDGPRVSYRYSYRRPDDPFEVWEEGRTVVEWKDVPADQLTAPAVWKALRTGDVHLGDAAHGDSPLIVTANVTGERLTTNAIKAVVDGAVAAVQYGVGLERQVVVLAQRLGASVSDILQLASGADRAVLGRCDRLIRADGGIDPDDHRIVAGQVVRTAADRARSKVTVRIATARARLTLGDPGAAAIHAPPLAGHERQRAQPTRTAGRGMAQKPKAAKRLRSLDIVEAVLVDQGHEVRRDGGQSSRVFALRDGKLTEVHVRSCTGDNYTYWQQKRLELREGVIAAVVKYAEGREPAVYFIPALEWTTNDPLLVSKDYGPFAKSPPEYALDFFAGADSLERYRVR